MGRGNGCRDSRWCFRHVQQGHKRLANKTLFGISRLVFMRGRAFETERRQLLVITLQMWVWCCRHVFDSKMPDESGRQGELYGKGEQA